MSLLICNPDLNIKKISGEIYIQHNGKTIKLSKELAKEAQIYEDEFIAIMTILDYQCKGEDKRDKFVSSVAKMEWKNWFLFIINKRIKLIIN